MVSISKDILERMYRRLCRIRAFEIRGSQLYKEGAMPAHFHSCIGEEAVAVGVCGSLTDDDYITSTHRCHGHLIAKGADMKAMLAEIYGKVTGCCQGKGGGMHLYDISKGILGANGIVGGGLPISLGAGLSSKYLKNQRVCVSFFGDGASNQGSFHESLNLAAVLDLPVVFVCENNQFALSTPQSYSQRIQNTADRAFAYGIPGVIVDGNSVIAVYEAAAKAVERARNGHGPTLLECKTWRYEGHFVGDVAAYKDAKEQAAWLKKDPLPRYTRYLEEHQIFTTDELQAIDEQVRQEVEEAVRFAEDSPLPTEQQVGSDVYTDMTEEVRSR